MSIAVPPADLSRPAPADADTAPAERARSASPWAVALRTGRVVVGGGVLLAVLLACLATLPWTLRGDPPDYARQAAGDVRKPPAGAPRAWLGYDNLGRSLLARCLIGGTISLAVGAAAAAISVVLGVTVGLVAGYRGGWVDALLMRTVDVLYGLPYILLVILFKIAFEPRLTEGVTLNAAAAVLLLLAGVAAAVVAMSHAGAVGWWSAAAVAAAAGVTLLWRGPGGVPYGSAVVLRLESQAANLVVLFSAIGLVSWLTMARVVRGQVLSLRAQPFIEACRAMGLPQRRIFLRHMLPNLVGPITVYATLTVPAAILQESFLSFLGVGVKPPLPTWGSLASEAVQSLSPVAPGLYWWQLLFPSLLLAVTLLSLNFLGDGLRDVFDPKREAAKI
jgi:oligopeptide transport system permease protein